MAARSTADLTRDYIRTSQYLTGLSVAVGDLILSGNKLVNIAGYTARVSELLEMVNRLEERGFNYFCCLFFLIFILFFILIFKTTFSELNQCQGSQPFVIREDGSSENVPQNGKPASSAEERALSESRHAEFERMLAEWKRRCDERAPEAVDVHRVQVPNGGTIVIGDDIEFDGVDLVSPDGKLLVKDLTCRVERGVNVMVTGPNGSGKSSLFRVIGELWPLQSGVLTKPPKSSILFLPQKPYLVLGTLRDQLIYPHSIKQMVQRGVSDSDLKALLSIVDPAGLILKEWSLGEVRDWNASFSGGQKQRVAFCRLFYHRPAFAILDECTSAVSSDVRRFVTFYVVVLIRLYIYISLCVCRWKTRCTRRAKHWASRCSPCRIASRCVVITTTCWRSKAAWLVAGNGMSLTRTTSTLRSFNIKKEKKLVLVF